MPQQQQEDQQDQQHNSPNNNNNTNKSSSSSPSKQQQQQQKTPPTHSISESYSRAVKANNINNNGETTTSAVVGSQEGSGGTSMMSPHRVVADIKLKLQIVTSGQPVPLDIQRILGNAQMNAQQQQKDNNNNNKNQQQQQQKSYNKKQQQLASTNNSMNNSLNTSAVDNSPIVRSNSLRNKKPKSPRAENNNDDQNNNNNNNDNNPFLLQNKSNVKGRRGILQEIGGVVPTSMPSDRDLLRIASRTRTPVPIVRRRLIDIITEERKQRVDQFHEDRRQDHRNNNTNNNNNTADVNSIPSGDNNNKVLQKIANNVVVNNSNNGSTSETNNNNNSAKYPVNPLYNVLSPYKIASYLPNGRYIQHQMLGSGSFGELYLCEWCPYDPEARLENGQTPPTTFGPGRGPHKLANLKENNKEKDGNTSAKDGNFSPHSTIGGSVKQAHLVLSGKVGSAVNGSLPRQNSMQPFPRTQSRGGRQLQMIAGSPNANNNNNLNGTLNSGTSPPPRCSSTPPANHINMSLKIGVATNTNDTVNGTLTGTGRISPRSAFIRHTSAGTNAPAGLASRMSCTKPFIRGANGTLIPRDSVFVCKRQRTDKKTTLVSRLGDKPNPLMVAQISEQRILANCAHPCICAFVEEFQEGQSNFLVMEYVDGKDLRHEIERRAGADEPFSEHSVLLLFVQILMALEYLHRHNILHRDLKSDNILLSRVWQVKLCDFGLAKQFSEDVDTAVSTTRLGTPSYISPEIFSGFGYSDKSDMWSCGVLLFELFNLQLPFSAPTVKELMKKVIEDPVPAMIRKGASQPFVDLMYKLLEKDPKKRPSAKEALQTPVMKKAMDEFVRGYAACARDSKRYDAPVDSVWAQLLLDHMRLVLGDNYSSQKSAIANRRTRAETVTTNWISRGGGGGATSSAAHSRQQTGGGGKTSSSSPIE